MVSDHQNKHGINWILETAEKLVSLQSSGADLTPRQERILEDADRVRDLIRRERDQERLSEQYSILLAMMEADGRRAQEYYAQITKESEDANEMKGR